MIMSKERKTLEAQGFEGFRPIGELMNGVKSVIPAQMGVYVVLREDNTKPVFVTKGTGGFFKGKDPNVPGIFFAAHGQDFIDGEAEEKGDEDEERPTAEEDRGQPRDGQDGPDEDAVFHALLFLFVQNVDATHFLVPHNDGSAIGIP